MWAWTSLLAIAALSVSPAPREIRLDDKGSFYVRADVLVVLPDSLYGKRESILAPLRESLGGAIQVSASSEVDRAPEGIYLGTAAEPGGLDRRKLRKYLDGAAALGDFGYRLTVEKNGVIIAAGAERGLWYGLHTLAALREAHGANLPYMRVHDWPALGVRGVYLNTLPSEADLRVYAAMKCTHLFLESADFYDLTGVRAAAWRNVFETARANYLEPVPVFSTLSGMAAFLRENPMLIEGRAVSEQITLTGVDWVPLRYPNIIAERPEDVRVSISGVACVHGKDYLFETEPLLAPFMPERPRWRIRRELEGGIPNAAQVTVDYSFATADSGTLCFAAPEAGAWLRAAMARLVTELRPRAIHLDHGAIGRLNTDPRTRALGLNDAAYFLQTLNILEAAVREAGPDTKLMIWADKLNPGQGATTYGLEAAAPYLSEGIARLGRVRVANPGEAEARFDQLQPLLTAPIIVHVEGDSNAAGTFQQMLMEVGETAGGIIVPAPTPEDAAPLMAMAWSGLGDASIWTRRLNRYFDVALTRPDFATLRGMLVRYLNEATLRGEDPAELKRAFEAFSGRHLDVLREDEAGFRLVTSMLALLTEYLTLEARFADTGDEAALRRLRAMVTEWQALEPQASGERYTRILDTIANQQLFVPASILFQEDLRYYREDRPEYPQFEIPVRPEFADGATEATATINLMPGQAAVRRMDFESVRLDAVTLAGRSGAGDFETIKQWAGKGIAGVRGPLLLPGGAAREALRVTASSSAAPAVLRDVRLFGPKEPPVLDGTYAVQAPPMVAAFENRAWSAAPQAGAFLQTDTARFAEAPTSVRVCRTRDDLYVGIKASDPRPDAIVADFIGRDLPLWQQESVEIWLQPEGRLPLRLVVSPLGAQYDSEADDGGWDGAWEVVAAKTETGWRAVVRIPIALAGELKRGEALPLNIVRNRHSVVHERSAWAHGYGAQPDLQWGALRFP